MQLYFFPEGSAPNTLSKLAWRPPFTLVDSRAEKQLFVKTMSAISMHQRYSISFFNLGGDATRLGEIATGRYTPQPDGTLHNHRVHKRSRGREFCKSELCCRTDHSTTQKSTDGPLHNHSSFCPAAPLCALQPVFSSTYCPSITFNNSILCMYYSIYMCSESPDRAQMVTF